MIRRLVESPRFQHFVLGVILLNAAIFGFQTSRSLTSRFGGMLSVADALCLAVFTVELLFKLFVYRLRFFRDPWNVFDFVIVAVSYAPNMGMFSAIRLFRVLRLFKIISGVRPMRVILAAIVRSIPGILWASLILGLIYYVYGIIGTNLFGASHPQWFGTLGESVYSLFQIMTLESWSMGIARPVIEVHPHAWIYFVSYVLVTSFVVMNIVVGIVLNSINESNNTEHTEVELDSVDEELKKLKQQIVALEKALANSKNRKG